MSFKKGVVGFLLGVVGVGACDAYQMGYERGLADAIKSIERLKKVR